MVSSQRIRIPASSANLGPGFDTLGLALAIYLECRFQPSKTLTITAEGRDVGSIPLDKRNLIWQTAKRVAETQQRQMPPLAIHITNDIPVGKGLGSSAAALVAGIVMASYALDLQWDEYKILDEATRLEGHPDNVAACVLGAATTATIDSNGITRAVRIEIPETFSFAVVCPNFELLTTQMRALLPNYYSRTDAVFNLQRATLLVAALATGNQQVFPEVLADRLHQPYRLAKVPGMEAIVKLRAPGLLGCTLSGSGPAILVFFKTGAEAVVDLVSAAFQSAGYSSEVFFTSVDHCGLKIM